MRYELKIALRYLRARRKEAFISVTTLFTAFGVMIGVAALTITLAVMSGFQQSIKERLLNMSPQVQIHSDEGSIAKYSEVEARKRFLSQARTSPRRYRITRELTTKNFGPYFLHLPISNH